MKRSLFIALLLAAALSCTGCGHEIGQTEMLPTASKPVLSSGTIEGSKPATTTTKAKSTDRADSTTTTKTEEKSSFVPKSDNEVSDDQFFDDFFGDD